MLIKIWITLHLKMYKRKKVALANLFELPRAQWAGYIASTGIAPQQC